MFTDEHSFILNKRHQQFLRGMLQHLNIALFLCTTRQFFGLASLPGTQMDMSEQQNKSQCQTTMKHTSAIGCRQLELHPLQQLITTRTDS